jgi:hypothetical protein
VYVLNNNENLKMSKYIPKVGEAFEKYNTVDNGWDKKGAAIFVTDNEVAVLDEGGMIDTFPLDDEFRPISTKSDVEREQLLEIIEECYDSGCSIITKGIQQAGFTIPKKIKRSDIAAIINKAHPLDITITIDFICELLGDLVDQDKGGAE